MGKKDKDCCNIDAVVIVLGLIFVMCVAVKEVYMTYYGPPSHEQPLVLQLHSLSVSNFNVSNSLLTASWDINLVFANQDSEYEISIESYESFLYYNQSDHAVSCATVEPIYLGTRRQKLVQIKFNRTGCRGGQPYIGDQDQLLEEMRKDGEKGSQNFKLRMDLLVMYQGYLLDWNCDLKPDCGDLYVKFVSATGTGELSNGPKACSVSFPKGLLGSFPDCN